MHALPARSTGVEPLLVVDATAAAPYLPLDLDTMGADVMVISGSAWGGTAVGAMVFRTPELLDRLPAVSFDAAARGPERLEIGDGGGHVERTIDTVARLCDGICDLRSH